MREVLARVVRARHYLPLTPLGLAAGALGFWLTFYHGPQKMDRVLTAAGLVALAVVWIALVSVVGGALVVWLAARRAPADLQISTETGGQVATGLRLPCMRIWPMVQLEVRWEQTPQVQVMLHRARWRCEEQLHTLERGEVQQLVRRFVVSDIFGFCRLGLARRSSGHLRVRPAACRVTAHVMHRFLSGDHLSHPEGRAEGEMIEMRRYVYGDPLRYVLWKAFARTRKLLVRAPERAIVPRPSSAAYLVAGPGDEHVASAARFFVEEGLLGQDFLFGADGTQEPAPDASSALDAIIASFAHRRRGAEDLDRFLMSLDQGRRSNMVLFVPLAPGPWLARVTRVARRMPGARVYLAIDSRPDAMRPGRLQRLLFSDRTRLVRAVRDLGRVTGQLAAAGLEVNVLHRPSGELLTRAQLDVLAHLAA